jgi:prepilin-type N-terminal cleavage/methylation domain-containing protein
MNVTKASQRKAGFTLIELSIVLVIIGLIVGGVLVGQDLIKAAEIRATMSQVEKYNTALNTFRGKYNGMPGDLQCAVAFSLGTPFTVGQSASCTGGMTGSAGLGDGNGLIEGGSTGATVPLGETLVFWAHLSGANLVDGSYGAVGNSAITAAGATLTGTVSNPAQSIPPSRLGRSLYFLVYASSGYNYYQLMPVTGMSPGVYTLGNTGIPGIEASTIDGKLDDGNPGTGIVLARSITAVNGTPTVAASATSNTCTIGSGTNADTYNLNAASGGTDPSCSLRFRFN